MIPRRKAGLAATLAVALPTLALAAPAAPAVRPATLMAQMYVAMGGARLDRLAGVQLRGRYELGGLPGRFDQTVDFHSGNDLLRYDVGVTSGEQATGAHFSWWMDEKGLVNVDDTAEVLAEAATESYLDRNGWLHPERDTPASYLGTEQEGTRVFDLLRLQPPGGRPLTLWIDRQTHLPDRIVEHDIEQQDDTTYLSDWHTVQGVSYPFMQVESSGDPRADVILRVSSLRWLSRVAASTFQPPLSRVADVRLPRGVQSITLPFALRDGMIIVQASIDGGPSLPFALDSGGLDSLTPATAARLGVPVRGNFALNGVGARLVDAQLATIDRLQLGDTDLLHQQFLVVGLPESLTYRGHEQPLAGLLGYELFRRFQVRIDYHHRTVTLRAPGSPAHGERLALQFEGRRPFVLATVDGTSGWFGVDTGDDGALTLFRHFFEAHALPIELPGIPSGQGGVGGFVPTLLTRVNTLSIGTLSLAHPLVELNFARAGAFASDFSAGNIGALVLRNFDVTLDYAARTLYLQRSADFAAEMAYNRSGLQFEVSGKGLLTVTSVSPDSPGAESGVLAGDQLLMIDGADLRGEDYNLIEEHFRQPAGTHLALVVLRHDQRVAISLTLRELLPPADCCRAPPGGLAQALSADEHPRFPH